MTDSTRSARAALPRNCPASPPGASARCEASRASSMQPSRSHLPDSGPHLCAAPDESPR